MSRPIVSVIINNYNYGRYLAEAIESALSQDYPSTEVVVVDDGSTDESAQIIARYGNRIVPILKPNEGQVSALNAGFSRSRGQIVIFLDSDDFLLPGAIATLVPMFDDAHVVKAHWPLWVVDEAGQRAGTRIPCDPPQAGNLKQRILETGPEDSAWAPTSGNAYRRSYLEEVFPIPSQCATSSGGSFSDAYLSMQAPLYGCVAAINAPVACYRRHGTNDHARLKFDEKLVHDMEVFDALSRMLERRCRALELAVDPQRWRNNSWVCRLSEAVRQLDRIMPAGTQFILIDEGMWNMPTTASRRRILFIERDGQYWGAPSDDRVAMEELERLRSDGARYLVFAWTSFWWFEHFAEFCRIVQTRFQCILNNELLRIFDLQSPHLAEQESRT